MEEHKVEIKDFKREARKRKFKEKLNKFGRWVDRNKETLEVVLPIASAGIAGTVKVAHGVRRRSDLRKEQELKNLYVYDRSLGHYWELKRPLKNSDWVEINNRRSNGETLGEILESLQALK